MKKVSLDKGREIETPWLSVEEAAVYCGVSRDTIWRASSDMKIPYSGSGKNRKYKTQDLDEWMKNRE